MVIMIDFLLFIRNIINSSHFTCCVTMELMMFWFRCLIPGVAYVWDLWTSGFCQF